MSEKCYVIAKDDEGRTFVATSTKHYLDAGAKVVVKGVNDSVFIATVVMCISKYSTDANKVIETIYDTRYLTKIIACCFEETEEGDEDETSEG